MHKNIFLSLLSLSITWFAFADKVEPPKDAVPFREVTTRHSSIQTAHGGKQNLPAMILVGNWL